MTFIGFALFAMPLFLDIRMKGNEILK